MIPHEWRERGARTQNLSLDCAFQVSPRLACFPMRRLSRCSFYLPVACGFILAGGAFSTESTLKNSEEILVLMGEYFQVQDDYLDAYAPPEVLGKIGTDIQDNKCSWLVVQAMKKASPAQLATLKANYGKHDAACVATVKALYVELGLEEVFRAYEQVRAEWTERPAAV